MTNTTHVNDNDRTPEKGQKKGTQHVNETDTGGGDKAAGNGVHEELRMQFSRSPSDCCDANNDERNIQKRHRVASAYTVTPLEAADTCAFGISVCRNRNRADPTVVKDASQVGHGTPYTKMRPELSALSKETMLCCLENENGSLDTAAGIWGTSAAILADLILHCPDIDADKLSATTIERLRTVASAHYETKRTGNDEWLPALKSTLRGSDTVPLPTVVELHKTAAAMMMRVSQLERSTEGMVTPKYGHMAVTHDDDVPSEEAAPRKGPPVAMDTCLLAFYKVYGSPDVARCRSIQCMRSNNAAMGAVRRRGSASAASRMLSTHDRTMMRIASVLCPLARASDLTPDYRSEMITVVMQCMSQIWHRYTPRLESANLHLPSMPSAKGAYAQAKNDGRAGAFDAY